MSCGVRTGMRGVHAGAPKRSCFARETNTRARRFVEHREARVDLHLERALRGGERAVERVERRRRAHVEMEILLRRGLVFGRVGRDPHGVEHLARLRHRGRGLRERRDARRERGHLFAEIFALGFAERIRRERLLEVLEAPCEKRLEIVHLTRARGERPLERDRANEIARRLRERSLAFEARVLGVEHAAERGLVEAELSQIRIVSDLACRIEHLRFERDVVWERDLLELLTHVGERDLAVAEEERILERTREPLAAFEAGVPLRDDAREDARVRRQAAHEGGLRASKRFRIRRDANGAVGERRRIGLPRRPAAADSAERKKHDTEHPHRQ